MAAVCCGKKYIFLDMEIELFKDGYFFFKMQSYTKEAIETFVTSPATSRLFGVTAGEEKIL